MWIQSGEYIDHLLLHFELDRELKLLIFHLFGFEWINVPVGTGVVSETLWVAAVILKFGRLFLYA